jgi:hypothetical protein
MTLASHNEENGRAKTKDEEDAGNPIWYFIVGPILLLYAGVWVADRCHIPIYAAMRSASAHVGIHLP